MTWRPGGITALLNATAWQEEAAAEITRAVRAWPAGAFRHRVLPRALGAAGRSFLARGAYFDGQARCVRSAETQVDRECLT
jgi:hypothetical protein